MEQILIPHMSIGHQRLDIKNDLSPLKGEGSKKYLLQLMTKIQHRIKPNQELHTDTNIINKIKTKRLQRSGKVKECQII